MTLKSIFLGLVALVAFMGVGAFAYFYKSDMTREQLAAFQTPASQFIDLPNGANMHYRDEGNPDAPVLVMVHGGFGSLQNWEGWIEPLGADLRLISMDLLGHGLTGTYPANVYTRITERDAVRELLQELGIEHYTVAGNSFGGGIALEMALAFPEDVTGLILVDSEGIPNSEDGYDVSTLTDEAPLAPDDPGYAQLSWYERLGARFIGPSVVGSVLDGMIHNKDLLTDEFVDRYGTIIRYTGNRDAQILMFRQGLHQVQQNGPQDLRPRLGELQMPVLVMHGEQDTLVPMRVAETFDAEIANSTLARIDQAGHMPMIEQPETTAEVVLEWFRDTGLLQ